MKYNTIVLAVLLSLLVVVAGCTSTTNSQQAPADQQNQAQEEKPLDQSVQEMMEFMSGNPDKLTNNETVAADQEFSASVLKIGSFKQLNYMTSGSVEIQKKDEKIFIVLGDDFSTPAGPDLVLYLTRNTDASTRADIREGLEIGSLKSTAGKQVYEIPADADISSYSSVTIHCRAFNVPWSYAPLKGLS